MTCCYRADEGMMSLEDMTLGELLQHAAQKYPDAPALRSGTEVWTYAELNHDTDQLAKGLLHAGLRKGNRAVVYMGNGCEMIRCIFALVKLGCVPILIGGSDSRLEISSLIAESGAQYLFFGGEIHGVSTLEVISDESFPRATPHRKTGAITADLW